MSRKVLIKSTGVIALATATSRILGFIRDILMANFFGTSVGAQAFVVAFRIPNSLRDLVGEGAMNSAIVPVLTEYKAIKDEKEFRHVSRVLFNASFIILSLLTLAGIVFSPVIVRLIAPGFLAEPEKFALTVKLNKIIFPYLVLIGLTAYSMGVLNSLKHFAAPAFGPVLLNISMIASLLLLCPRMGVMALTIGVLAGGALQLALNLPFLYANGIGLNFRDGFRHPAVKKIGRLLVPRALGTAVYQINIFVDTILASLGSVVGAGGVAALYYANRLIQFPLAIFGLALAQAALPKMSHEFAVSDINGFKETLSFSLRVVFLVMIPASFGLAVLGGPMIRILFERGEFTAYSTSITESALFFYAFGLASYGGIKLLVTSFYSMHDTMTPVKTALAAVAINIMLNIALMFPLKLGGIALATSISATFNFVTLFILLRRRIGDFGTHGIIDSFSRVFAASLAMAVLLKLLLATCASRSISGLIVYIMAGIAAFILFSHLLGVKETRELSRWILKKI